MAIKLNPYISFTDNARQAMEFYHSVFGGNLTVSTFKEYGGSGNPADDDKIMHANLETEDGLTIMAADTRSDDTYTPGSSISMSLGGHDAAGLRSIFEGLAAGGTVLQPLESAPWGDTFGMLTDKFGVTWMVNIVAQPA